MVFQSFCFGFCLLAFELAAQTSIHTNTSLPSRNPVAACKKVIEFGWDEPDTAFLRQHIGQMERALFDGCVFHVNFNRLS